MTLPQRGANLRGQPLPRLTQLCQSWGLCQRRVTSLWQISWKTTLSQATSVRTDEQRVYPAMGHPCTASIVRAIEGTSTDWQRHDQWLGLLQNLDSNRCWTTGNHGNAGVAQATGAIVPVVTGGMLALPERTIIGHRSWPPPLGSNHTGILISGNPTAEPTQWVGLNTARGIKVRRIKSAGDINSSQAGPGAAIRIRLDARVPAT